MRINLPIIKERYYDGDGKLVVERGELPVTIDASMLAHLKWEEHFEKQLGVNLTEYTERVSKWVQNPEEAKLHFLSLLKWLYCYVNSDALPTFIDFVKLFQVEVMEESIKKIADVLSEIMKYASKN